MIQLEPLQHQDPAVAQQIHAVLALAYAQEAQLLGLPDFPPLQRSSAELQADSDAYLGARIGGELVGALAFLLLEEWLAALTPHWMAPLGIAIVLVVLLAQRGLYGSFQAWALRRERAAR